jgi:class 3 adenylate cyclase
VEIGERRSRRGHVCVLFADISGFTHLVETVDPEVVYELVRPLMDELVAVVHEFDGEIQQVLGDGFMSVFGLHRSRTDDVARAVQAGLAAVSTGGAGTPYPPVHVGIECGEVLVTPSWEPAGYGVWGRAVNLAKRLCDSADAGEVRLGPAAFGRVGDRIGPAAPVQAWFKGVSSAVIAYRLLAQPAPELAVAG